MPKRAMKLPVSNRDKRVMFLIKPADPAKPCIIRYL